MSRAAIAVLMLSALTVVAPSWCAVDEHVVVTGAGELTGALLSRAAGDRLLVVAKERTAAGDLRLVYATSGSLARTWDVKRLPLPPNETWGDPFGAAMTSVAPDVYLYWATLANPRLGVPIWRSTGGAWTMGEGVRVAQNASRRQITSIGVASDDGRIIYAAGHEVINGQMLAQIWLSTDGGVHWDALCEDGRLAYDGSATALGGETAPTLPQPADIGVLVPPTTGIISTVARSAGIGDVTPNHIVWGWIGEQIFIAGLGDRILLFPAFEGCMEIVDMYCPGYRAIYAYWLQEPALQAAHYIAFSDTVGQSWDQFVMRAERAHSDWDIPIAGKVFAEFTGPGTGLVAAQIKAAAGDLIWRLFSRENANEIHDPWAGELLAGYDVLGIEATGLGQLFILARTWNPGALYCLRWPAQPIVGNRAPTGPPQVAVNPPRPTTANNFRVTPAGSTDPNGDEVTYVFQWWRNGKFQPDRTDGLIRSRWTATGDIWQVIITPTDGQLNGPPANIVISVE